MRAEGKLRLMNSLVGAIKSFQDAVDRFDTAAAAALDINTTDLRCVTALHDRGPLSPAQIAVLLGLTRGAVTTALRRVELAGYTKRRVHEQDARSVVIEWNSAGHKSVRKIWATMRLRGRKQMNQYSQNELKTITVFFEQSIVLQEVCTSALLTQRSGRKADRRHRDVESRRTLSRRSVRYGRA